MIEDNQNISIIDTHIHLDDDAFDHDRQAVIEASRDAGVVAFVNIGYSPERWESSARLRDSHPEVAIALGLHPFLAEQFTSSLAQTLKGSIDRLKPVALGEMGLDFAPGNPAPEIQARAFSAQLEIASALGLPIIIHQRAAADEVAAVIDRSGFAGPIVLHSFDGTPRLTDWAISRRAFIGIGGLATRSSSEQLRQLLARLPTDRLVLETDAPYLVPAGIKDRRNVPANLPFVATRLAPLWGIGPQDLCRVTTANASELFGMSLPAISSSKRDGEMVSVEAASRDE